jgi:hypothetical protein
MPKWLQGMVLPTLLLWIHALAMGISSGVSGGGGLSWRVDVVSRVTLGLIMATWVYADAQKRNWPLCYDYGSFVFFAWPIVATVYLFRTRGAAAFLTILCFIGMSVSSTMLAAAIFTLRELLAK